MDRRGKMLRAGCTELTRVNAEARSHRADQKMFKSKYNMYGYAEMEALNVSLKTLSAQDISQLNPDEPVRISELRIMFNLRSDSSNPLLKLKVIQTHCTIQIKT